MFQQTWYTDKYLHVNDRASGLPQRLLSSEDHAKGQSPSALSLGDGWAGCTCWCLLHGGRDSELFCLDADC